MDLEITLKKLKRQFQAACLHEKDWRLRAREWFDYFHGDQIKGEVLTQMLARSQAPIKFNLIKTIVSLLTGQEIQGRTDIQFLGFGNEDELTAELLTEIYRQKNHADDFQYELTESFQDGVIAGRGVVWEDWDEEEKEIVREYISWKEVYVDPASKKADFSDARHVFRVKWVDVDVAKDMFPNESDKFDAMFHSETSEDDGGRPASQKEDYFDEIDNEGSVRFADGQRQRIKLIEAFWYEGKKVFTGVFTDEVWLEEAVEFNRKHGKFPFIFTFYERDSEDMPYGLVKDLVDPQDVINKMLAKSMHILGTKQILAEKGALKNLSNVQNNISRPDAVIADFEDGALSQGKVIINDNRNDAGLAFQHFDTALSAMHRISGVNPELQGLNTNARSGTAISMRLRQGNTVLTKLYDCLEKTKKKVARNYIYLMSQFVKGETIARYKDPLGTLKQVTLNETRTEVVGEEIITIKRNDIKDIFEFDIAITESAKVGNQNESEFTQLVELFKAVPQAMTPMALAELIKSTHLPNKEDLAKALMPPPSAQGDAMATSNGAM
jgi:hypothetical protein